MLKLILLAIVIYLVIRMVIQFVKIRVLEQVEEARKEFTGESRSRSGGNSAEEAEYEVIESKVKEE